ncbi:MAG: sulfatase-like hydrolase/transferase [Bryobacteraceae bacterium]|nr:sulfatase-like hydrolase/transferase [Bryobacteraceae bacterium]
MNRRNFLSMTAAPFLQTASKAAEKRPNVVMFMTDDHGAWATGAYGCAGMHTPNIDELARTGIRFDRAFACTPVCSPSRMTWITGRIPSVHGVQDWLRPEDSFEKNTRRWLEGHTPYSTILARNGYTLGMCGKWHMGEDDKAQYGFSYWATVPGGGGPYRNVEFVRNGTRTKLSEFKTDSVGDCALEFLEQSRGRQPFYLLVPFYAPHTPFDFQPEAYRKHYNEANFGCFPDTPKHAWQNPGLGAHHGNRKSMHSYSALISGVDANVGRVLRKLDELGLRGDTSVVFTADQGWNAGHHGVWGKGNGTWPFNMYDESIRVPLIWNHPGRIKPAQLRQMVSSYDYFPTLMDHLGIKAPADPLRPGRSYAGLLRGQSPRWQNRLYFEYSFVRGVRTENLKLVRRTREWPSEFYDLERDPGEKNNLIGDPAHARQIAALDRDMDAWFKKAGAPPIEQWRGTTKQNLTVYQR